MVSIWARSTGFGRGVAAYISAIALGVVCAGAMAASPPPEHAPATGTEKQVLNGSRAMTRFVIGLERNVEFQVFSLQNPNRVIVDLPDVKVQLPSISGNQPVGLVQSFRGGLASAGKMRVVIDVTEPVVVETSKLESTKDGKSPRLVLEIVPVDAAKPAKKPLASAASINNIGLSGVQPPLPKPAVRPEVRAARTFKPVIVLDPGHGGQDSGCRPPWGRREGSRPAFRIDAPRQAQCHRPLQDHDDPRHRHVRAAR